MVAELKNGQLVVTMDIDPQGRLSATGKTMVVGTTGGFVGVPGYGIKPSRLIHSTPYVLG